MVCQNLNLRPGFTIHLEKHLPHRTFVAARSFCLYGHVFICMRSCEESKDPHTYACVHTCTRASHQT